MLSNSSINPAGGLGRTGALLVWHGLALLAITLGSQAFAFRAISRGDLGAVGFALLAAIAYLGLALALALTDGRSRILRVAIAAAAAVASYGAVWAILDQRADLSVPGRTGLAALAAGIPLAVLPYLVGRYLMPATALLAVALIAAVLGSSVRRTAPGIVTNARNVSTALKHLTLTTYRNLAGPLAARGGAIQPHKGGLLVINDIGEFYRMTRGETGELRSSRLEPVVPMNRSAYLTAYPDPSAAPKLRVTDLVIGQHDNQETLFVAHQYWNADERCFTKRLSRTPASSLEADDEGAQDDWTTVYESAPCVKPTGTFNDDGNGGRLGWYENKLLLTIGDHGFDGKLGGPMLAQTDDNPYGKVLLVDPASGEHEVFSKGHRNPQGLFVDSDQRIWVTEHGPAGGDELNLLTRGANYGWPVATYGTDYGRRSWSLDGDPADHGEFAEPIYAFIPSPGISPVIGVTSDRFPEWRGDLLIGSLRTESLWRTRVREGRVVYVERIEIGGRVWDIAEGPDGSLFVWTNAGTVIEIAPSDPREDGDAVYARCISCHEAPPGETPTAPSLHFIMRKDVAAQEGFDYSPALRTVGGRWDAERMDAFLRDPNAFAPGSRMSQGRVEDPVERRAIIEFLTNYR